MSSDSENFGAASSEGDDLDFDAFDRTHKNLFNQEGVRRRLLRDKVPNAEIRFLDIGIVHRPPDLAWHSVGTIYEEFGDGDAHFLAFRKLGNVVTIMDPSGMTGPYSLSPREWEDKYWPLFPGCQRVMAYPGMGPQHYVQDTLCQTWSLAWLIGHARDCDRAAVRNYQPFTEMRNIFASLAQWVEQLPPSSRKSRWLQLYEEGRPQLREYFSDGQVPRPRRLF